MTDSGAEGDLFDRIDANDAPGDPVEEPNNKTEASATKRRVVRNPKPKLDNERLCGSRGIIALGKIFEDAKPQFKGKGHEKEDLVLTMKLMEYWSHRLFPKLPFDNVLDRIERLGAKKPVQNYMKKFRLDMLEDPETNTDYIAPRSPSDDEGPRGESIRPSVQPNFFENDDFIPEEFGNIPDQPDPEPVIELTEEQRDAIAAKRLAAIERRARSMLQKEHPEELPSKDGTESQEEILQTPTLEINDLI